MEPKPRGITKEHLDNLLTDEYLEALSENYKTLKALTKSKQEQYRKNLSFI